MKKPSALIYLIISLAALMPYLLAAQPASKEDSEWYPFVLPEKLDPNSPVNIGKLVLDPPAGKHGFVKVKDGHFYFEDGTRAKFWGTNLCFSACFPAKKQAKIIADRLAFFGFNAVRLHHMDFYFEPRGIFEDVCPAYKHPQLKQTGHLSKRQLDKLDYFIYQLKQRGIYVDMNLLVSRHFTEADGVKDAEKLGMAAKPVSMFDAKLIELQKKYAKDLLTHYNKYTKLRYCDDPVIALVEITNENSIAKLINKKTIPDYYQNQLAEKYTQWLNENPQIKDRTKTNFYRYLEKQYFKQMTDFLKTEIGVKAPISGSQYSDVSTQESCDFIDTHAYWDHPRFPNKPWDHNDFRIHNRSILTNNNLGIIGTIKQRANSYEPRAKPFTVSEWNHCYPNQYAYETPLLLAAEAKKNDWDALFQFAFSHGWNTRKTYNSIHSYFDINSNAQQLILTSFASRIFFGDPNVQFEVNDTHASIFLKKENLTINIGAIKNTASGWDSEGRFNWGRSPTLMKKFKQ